MRSFALDRNHPDWAALQKTQHRDQKQQQTSLSTTTTTTTTTTTMTTPWERIVEDSYKSWLLKSTSVEEYNGLGPVDRGTLLSQFQQQQQQQQELQLFKLTFLNIPTGSSGVPHIHNDLADYRGELMDLPLNDSSKPLYQRFHVDDEEGKVYYSRELQVQIHLQNVLKDVIRSCGYHLKTDTEAALNGLRVDIGIIRNRNGLICGTMEVKQPQRKNQMPPDPDPMDHPKVVTQILSQMIPLRTLYGVENVYGILSTYSSWRFFKWVPEDESVDAKAAGEAPMEEDVMCTPQKSQLEVGDKPTRKSPPMSPKPYRDVEQGEEDNEEGEGTDFTENIKQGKLYASRVVSDGPQALKMLAWVLGEMAASPIHHKQPHERDYLYVIQKGALGGYQKLEHSRDYYKGRMPSSNNKTLYILEELGHRYHGRVYRAMSKNGNLCVLKYFVKSQSALMENATRREVDTAVAASKSVEYWNKAYGEQFLPSATWGRWGGGVAMIMPDLEKMSDIVHDHDTVLQMLEKTMKERFFNRELWHGDPTWRNVALVRNKENEISKVVMIDLEPQRMMEKVEYSEWNFTALWNAFKQNLDNEWETFLKAEGARPIYSPPGPTF